MRRMTSKVNPLILYSTNTWLAFAIAQQYYSETHYAWCSPFFREPDSLSGVAAPPSAIPGAIYDTLTKDVTKGDRHSLMINRNKVGILKGADARFADGTITQKQRDEIIAAVEESQVSDFKPILYVIPFSAVQNDLVVVFPKERAHPMSKEYRIENLARSLFDPIELRNGS